MASFVDCENTSCPHFPEQQTFPAERAIWIDGTYTVCSESCKAQFLAAHPRIAETLTYEPDVLPTPPAAPSDPFREQGLLFSLRALVTRLVS